MTRRLLLALLALAALQSTDHAALRTATDARPGGGVAVLSLLVPLIRRRRLVAAPATAPGVSPPGLTVPMVRRRRGLSKVVYPPDFWTALLAWMNADVPLSTAFPGGFLQGNPAVRQAMPFCAVDQLDANNPATFEDDVKRPGFRVYATSDVAAARCVALLASRLRSTSVEGRPIMYEGVEEGRPWMEAGWNVIPPASFPRFVGYSIDRIPVWKVERQFLVYVVAYDAAFNGV